jgi:integrase/recombinase XerD
LRVEKAFYEHGAAKWLLVDDEFRIVEEVLQFTNYLYAAGYSPNTIEGYLRDIKTFLLFLKKKQLCFFSVEASHIPEYVAYLADYGDKNGENDEWRSNTTINRMLAAVASCYRYHVKVLNTIEKSPFVDCWILRPGDMGKSLFHHVIKDKATIDKSMFYRRIQRKRVKRLMPEQVNAAYEGFTTQRDRLMFKVFYNTGLRIGELLGLRVDDYQMPDANEKFGVINVVRRQSNMPHQRQKTGERTIDVPMSHIFEIEEYVTHQRPYIRGVSHLFVADKGRQRGLPLTRKTVEKVFQACAKKTGVPFTPHVLRHTHFSELAEFGYDEAFLKARGGWARLESAGRYLHLSPEAQRKAFERFWEASYAVKL